MSESGIENPATVEVDALNNMAGSFLGILIWVLIGCAVIWLISFVGESALQKFRPVVVFMLIAGFAGFLIMRAANA